MMLSKIKKNIEKIFGPKPIVYINFLRSYKSMKSTLAKDKRLTRPGQNFSKVAILFVGTKKYVEFFPEYYETLNKLFLPETHKDFFVFTDNIGWDYLKDKKNVKPIKTPIEKFPLPSLHRFKYINTAKKELKKYSHLIYIDADMKATSQILENEFFGHIKPLFGVQHPYFVNKIPSKSLERDPKSKAYVKFGDEPKTYWQGCFWGGKSEDVLKMSEILAKNIEEDLRKDIIAKWWDESHLNKYFGTHGDNVHTFSPAYAFDEIAPIPKPFRKKIVHLRKNSNEIRY